jgi:hypothetical protein
VKEKRAGRAPQLNANGRQKVTGAGRGQGGGRALLPIDAKAVEGMAFVGTTNQEIADFLETTPALIERRFMPLLRKSRASMRVRLRRAQFEGAKKGNVALLLWLGKQWLGQDEHGAAELSAEPDGPRQVIVVRGKPVFF